LIDVAIVIAIGAQIVRRTDRLPPHKIVDRVDNAVEIVIAGERIRLPLSQLAKPPETSSEQPLTLQVSRIGTVYVTGDEVPVDRIRPYLLREVQLLERQNKDKTNTTVIIRGDVEVQSGKVQQLIKECQDVGFEKFSLRAKLGGR
jgi:biopolymer transport protein ExbD